MTAGAPTLLDGAATGAGSLIRVLVADDSAFMRTAITRMVESDPQLKVVGAAHNGVEALELAATLNPDVITLDIEMPRLDGLGVLQRLMEENPRPVIIVSSLSQEGAEATLQALDLGAFDCIPKQLSYASLDIIKIRDHLVEQIKAAAVSRPRRRLKTAAPAPVAPVSAGFRGLARPEVVVIGTSTGGPGALREIIPALPADLPVGVLVVQHMPTGFTGPLARRLDSLSAITVREATDGHLLQAGEVLIAPAGFHMTVSRNGAGKSTIRVGDEPNGTLHKPSVDVTMLSAAEAFGARAMGVILTGMGSDGARGMSAIRERGGITVGQDEATSVVYGMPRACAERGILRRVAPLGAVCSEIVAAARISRS
jgi:two-component system chemotaxis response regulator CheB